MANLEWLNLRVYSGEMDTPLKETFNRLRCVGLVAHLVNFQGNVSFCDDGVAKYVATSRVSGDWLSRLPTTWQNGGARRGGFATSRRNRVGNSHYPTESLPRVRH